LTPETTAHDVSGWNSFRQVEIILEVEERFAIKLTTSDVDKLECVGDLVTIIAAKTGSVA
jgi:acyl carrier protein